MNLPNLLKKWSTIWICAPSKWIHENQKDSLRSFIKYVESLWLYIKLSKNLFWWDERGISCWTAQQRADDLNSLFADTDVDAIWCFQGWDNCLEIIDLIDYKLIWNNPKLLLWKSDIDILLMAIHHKTWITTIHCPDSKIGWRNKEMDYAYSKKRFKKRLFNWEWWLIEQTNPRKTIRSWRAKGKIIWCNINSISKLNWTDFFPDFTNVVLCFEVYLADPELRLAQFKSFDLQWVFEKISWIIIWYNLWFQDSEWQKKNPTIDRKWNVYQFEELLLSATRNYNFPILKINEFWHYCPNCFLPIWAECKLDADAQTVEIL